MNSKLIQNSLKIFIFLFSVFSVNSQSIKLKGTVVDSLKTPLSYVTVLAKAMDVTKAMKFAITEESGLYRLDLEKELTYTISLRYLGYENFDFEFKSSKNEERNIVLKEATNQLDEVLIELPMIVKTDTIIYNTDKFITGEEHKLKDVLKKLPGVEVDKNGSVTVQGKKVTHMLVEGKKFFGGGSKLAVENLPANAVDKVEVIDDYNEVAFLKGLNDTEDMAMNIKLKEDKKKFAFGDIEGGKGNKEYYKLHSNLFYYHPKLNVNFIGNLNNIGEKTFSFSDYMNFQGGASSMFNSGNSIRSGAYSDFAPFMRNSDALRSENKMGAFNITRIVSDKLDVGGYLIFSDTKVGDFEGTLNEYTVPEDTYLEEKSSAGNHENLLGIGKLNIAYAPNGLEQWYFKTQFKGANNASDRTILSKIASETTSIVGTKDADSYVFNENIEWHKKMSEKHTFSFTANINLQKNAMDSYWQTNQSIFSGLIPLSADEDTKLSQLKETKQNYFNAIFKHYWVLNSSNHIYTTLGNDLVKYNYVTNEHKLLEDGTEIDLTPYGFGNDLDYDINDLYAGVHYKFKVGIIEMKQGAFAHYYSRHIDQNTTIKNNKFLILPDFLAKINFSRSEKIVVKYNLKSSYSDVSKLANRFYLQSYNSIFKGDEALENELSHTASVFYRSFSLYRRMRLMGGIYYINKTRGIQNRIQAEGINSYQTAIMVNNPNESWSGNLAIEKTIKTIKYKFKTRLSTTKYIENINSTTIETNRNQLSYELSAKTLNEKYPILEVGFKQSLGVYASSQQTSKFTTNEPFANIAYDFLDTFKCSFDYIHYNYQNKSQNLGNKYDIANAAFSYGKDLSAWEFKITAQNLFDVQFKRRNSFNSYIISDIRTYIMPRVLIFSV
ncbi:MAG: carboxypeptidase-like regulatory domain-containing protein, partial [Bacteroidetes bacterium]|nr:carboxypeptidase-like regulatory domain-containing protein [Bacteroidota bacterium]